MSTIYTMQLKFIIGYLHTTIKNKFSHTNESEHFIHMTSTFQNVILNKKFKQKPFAVFQITQINHTVLSHNISIRPIHMTYATS